MRRSFWRVAVCGALPCLVLMGCGSGGGSGASTVRATPNSAVVNVDGFTGYGADSGTNYAAANQLYVTIKICPHGSTSNCETIDHIVIDTGSLGLRVLASSLAPPTSANFGSSTGLLASVPTIQATSSGSGASVTGVLAECQQFGGGYSWGSVRNVDITFAGTQETVSNIPMQVMGDMEPAPAANCAALSTTGYELTGSTTNASGVAIANPLTYQYLGANGIVGLSLFAQDCDICTTTAEPPLGTGTTPGLVYAVCADSTGNHCTPTTLPLNQQVVNPVAMLATDNNGFLIRMPPVGTAGAASATGSIIFGIGTQSNNALGNVTKYLADPNEEPGFVYTTYDAVANQFGIFDSGSSLYYFEDPTGTIQLCGTTAPADQYYCPGGSSAQSGAAGTTLHLTATINDWLNDAEPSAVTPFSITNLVNLASTSYAANDIGGPQVLDYFIWGMPSFYGKTLYFGVSSAANNNASPFYAF